MIKLMVSDWLLKGTPAAAGSLTIEPNCYRLSMEKVSDRTRFMVSLRWMPACLA